MNAADLREEIAIPETDSIEELAKFWDTHDLTDYEDQLEQVPGPMFQREVESIVVPPAAQSAHSS